MLINRKSKLFCTFSRWARLSADGFTLLEVLVALFIFSLIASTMLASDGSILTKSNHVRNKVVASWVAENVMVQQYVNQLPFLDVLDVDDYYLAGNRWRVKVKYIESDVPSMYRVEVTVGLFDDSISHKVNNYSYKLLGFVRENSTYETQP